MLLSKLFPKDAFGADGAHRELAVNNLTVRFQGLSAISNVTLSIGGNEILGLIGPNGAGKTTLVNCLTGFQKPTEGQILFNGHDTTRWTAKTFRRRGVARTFQAGRLFKDMTVLENALVTGVALGMGSREARAQARALLDWTGLKDRYDHLASSLAYTDQRRLGIARALMVSPRFVLLDEPAAGMSDTETEELMGIIGEMPKMFDCSVMLIEHNMHLVMSICGRVHVLDGGKTLAEGAPEEIKRHESVINAYLGMEE